VILGSLLQSKYLGADRVILDDQPIPAFNVHAPLSSLPRIFATMPESVPAVLPYIPQLEFDAITWSFWQERLERFAGERVGFFWSNDLAASKSLAIAFEPLGSITGISVISLQKGVQSADLPRGVGHLGGAFNEATWADMAVLVSGLDLVITVDSPLAHLAGTLGVPVWLALSFVPDSRWLLNREDSPWYPSMRLFRQPSSGSWDSVFASIAVELKQWARSRVSGAESQRRRSGIEFTGGIHLDNT
jgi:hypothetical protein